MRKNPFGDDKIPSPKANPFGETGAERTPEEALSRVEQAARKIRGLRMQLGAEGLTIPATRELIDEIAASLEAVASALRGLDAR